jgi:biopolymer transport protein ExbD
MSMFRRHRRHDVPALNTASLPDLIFTVLFFFMIVTHMRQVTLKVQYQVPTGTELTKLTKKSAVTYIYIGARSEEQGARSGEQGARSGDSFIQMNDKLVSVDEIQDYVIAERNTMSPEDASAMTVSIKADRMVPVGIITDVKQSLRKVNALRINYSAVSRSEAKE